MNIIADLLALKEYTHLVNLISEKEKNRIYCKHDLDHFFDVARIATILNHQHKLNIDVTSIYLVALLHDIGRAIPVEGEKHSQTSAHFAERLLQKLQLNTWQVENILTAIKKHQFINKAAPYDFISLISLADNLSRKCYICQAQESCNWLDERKNHKPLY